MPGEAFYNEYNDCSTLAEKIELFADHHYVVKNRHISNYEYDLLMAAAFELKKLEDVSRVLRGIDDQLPSAVQWRRDDDFQRLLDEEAAIEAEAHRHVAYEPKDGVMQKAEPRQPRVMLCENGMAYIECLDLNCNHHFGGHREHFHYTLAPKG